MSFNNVYKYKLLFLLPVLLLSTSYAQQIGFSPVWDKHFGGHKDEIISVAIPLGDGGILLAGTSFSGQSFDLTEPNRDSTLQSSDYWIIRTDSAGNKLWEKRFGGSSGEILTYAILASDGGFLLGGISYSGMDGDKSQANHDTTLSTPDIWLVRTDSLGNKIWDARFGGSASEQFGELAELPSGHFVIAGSTYSGISGEVSETGPGGWDYWMVLTDSGGNYLMDKRFGGAADDFCTALQLTSSQAYVLGGYSRSGIGGDKTQPSQGGADYWIVQTDTTGNKWWDKSFGGTLNDWLFDLSLTAGQNLILGGQSYSGATGDKSDPNHDPGPNGSDRWIIKTDPTGIKLWDKTYGADQTEDVNNLQVLPNGNIMICGESYSSQNGDKTEANLGPEQTWILMTDSSGTILWDKTLFTFSHDEKGYTIVTDENCFITVNYTRADSSGYKTQDNYGEGDFWMIKMCPDSVLSAPEIYEANIELDVMPNPASDYLTLKITGSLYGWYHLALISMAGETIMSQHIEMRGEKEIPVSVTNAPSGVYVLILSSEKNSFFQKAVISRQNRP